MEDILIITDQQGGRTILTTSSPQSHYGIPVLRIESDDCEGDFGPADLIGDLDDPDGGVVSAADVVAGWANQPGRTAEERKLARLFCSQWPDGPQIQE